MKKHSASWFAAVFCTTLIFLGGWGLYRTGFFAALSSPAALEAYIDRFSPYGEIAFFMIQLLSVLLPPIPNNMLALAGGVVFGMAKSFILTILAIYVGSVGVFLLARILGRPFVRSIVKPETQEKYLKLLRARQDRFFALSMMLPYFPDDLFCLLMGLTDIPLPRFTAIVVLTRPWGILFASSLGSMILSLPPLAIAALLLIGLLFLLLGLKYGDRLERALIRLLHKK